MKYEVSVLNLSESRLTKDKNKAATYLQNIPNQSKGLPTNPVGSYHLYKHVLFHNGKRKRMQTS